MYCISYLFIYIKKDIHFSIILLLLSTDHNSYYRIAHNLFCKINRRIGKFRQQLKIQHTKTYTWYDDEVNGFEKLIEKNECIIGLRTATTYL